MNEQEIYYKLNSLLIKNSLRPSIRNLYKGVEEKYLIKLTEDGKYTYIDEDLTIKLLDSDNSLIDTGDNRPTRESESKVYQVIFNKDNFKCYLCYDFCEYGSSEHPFVMTKVEKKEFYVYSDK